MVEVKQPSFNKGTAVRELMQHAPFKGRRPIFIGDDVTDEAAFEVLPEFDGVGFSVGREVQGIAGMFETPSDVRRWIAEMVRPEAGGAMNVHQTNVDVAAAQQSLDLAVIGNGRTAALVNPMARIVWWCFPALRRRSGVLPAARGRRGEGLHRRPARRVRVGAFGICAQHRDSSRRC